MARADQDSCGESHESCGAEEHCCEHRVGTFCEGDGCSNVHMEGQCAPKEKSCAEFWCGNRRCQTSWIFSNDVCCVYYPEGSTPEYSCKSSELSCPGNTAQLTLRTPTLASTNLQSQ